LLGKFKKELETKQAGLAEKLRKVICGEAEAEETGRMMVALNQAMAGYGKDLMDKYSALVMQLENNQKGRNNLKEKLAEVEENNVDKSLVATPAYDKERIEVLGQKVLERKNQIIQDLENELTEAKEGQIVEQDLQEVEARVKEMAELLQIANKALLAAGLTVSRENSRPGTPNQAHRSRSPNTTHSRCGRPLSPGTGDISMDMDDNDLLNDWQHDYDGLELIEWNNNLSKKLVQYCNNASRLLLGEEFSLLPAEFNSDVSCSLSNSRLVKPAGINASRTIKSAPLFSRLAELQHEASRSRDLLLMASESMREDMSIREETTNTQNLVPLKFPKTVGCQTEHIVEEAVEAKEDNKEVDGEDKVVEKLEGTWWPCLLSRLVCFLLLVLVYFTFFCGIEIEGVEYYPFTWYPLRRLVWLPEPLVTIRYQKTAVPLVW